MNERLLRTRPVLQAKTRVLDERRAAFAAAHRAANQARNVQLQADGAWEQRALEIARTRYETIADHLEARAHLDALKRAAAHAAERTAAASREEANARAALLAAERDLKKVEAWRDGIVEAEKATAARIERLGADELAARIHQAGR